MDAAKKQQSLDLGPNAPTTQDIRVAAFTQPAGVTYWQHLAEVIEERKMNEKEAAELVERLERHGDGAVVVVTPRKQVQSPKEAAQHIKGDVKTLRLKPKNKQDFDTLVDLAKANPDPHGQLIIIEKPWLPPLPSGSGDCSMM